MSMELGRSLDTTDLNLASFLVCRGFSLIRLRRNGGRTTFVFADSEKLEEAMLAYANDGPVGVRSFCATLRDLKGLIRYQEGTQ